MNDPSQMMNGNYGIWPPPILPPPAVEDPMGLGRPRPVFFAAGPNPSGRVNWKSKKAVGKRKKAAEAAAAAAVAGEAGGAPGAGMSGSRPPSLNDPQFQSHARFRRFYPKKKFPRFAPFAPLNTTSFLIRAKKAGGIASLVSPCPVTPAVLPTPQLSPSRESLGDMAKEEWGVDGYGSMKGFIRLRSPTGNDSRGEDDDDAEEGSSGSDVEEHVEVERRLDHDLSRFVMVYPHLGDERIAPAYLSGNRMDDHDAQISHLEEENLTLKERLFLMEREMRDLSRRLRRLETRRRGQESIHHDHSSSNNSRLNDAAAEDAGGDEVSSRKSTAD